ncbi:hypothetical protein MASR1M32_37910 [Rhodobacter sp.]
MIIGPDFIWLHFPKCGGTSVEAALRKVYGRDERVAFDPIDLTNVIWHQSIAERGKQDPSFNPEGKRLVCCIRRLPHWLLSRIHFEVWRSPTLVPSRENLIKGRFYESGGFLGSADAVFRRYNSPAVDDWIRVEHLSEDFSRIFQVENFTVPIVNEAKIFFVKSLSFWFTADDLRQLYEANPKWAELEQSIYGNLLTV